VVVLGQMGVLRQHIMLHADALDLVHGP